MAGRKIKISFTPYRLIFKEPAGTSRGVLNEKLTFFLRIADCDNPDNIGYGEVPVFPGLSKESVSDVEKELKSLLSVENSEILPSKRFSSSLTFGIEQALASLEAGPSQPFFQSPFTAGECFITINGLIWMGSFERMKERIREKLLQGFQCIKIKIGAISWDDELRLIRYLRDLAGDEITIRVDANGAFGPQDCLWRLEQLSALGVHSIEQPIRAGNPEEMKKICSLSPLPIALDEELIGLPPGEERTCLLEYIRPAFIILKPALCYGFSGSTDWIERAENLGVGWWITSALESSVGLDAIARFTGRLNPSLPQGLGTGSLYVNNFDSPLLLEGERLFFRGPENIYARQLETLRWIENG